MAGISADTQNTVNNAGSDGSDSTGGINGAIDDMKAAFEQAIETNAEITVLKTRLGAEETAAQQRPNIG